MPKIELSEAVLNLARIIEDIETGPETEVVIARNGQPVARLVRFEPPTGAQRIGVAQGRFVVPDSIDDENELIARLFKGE